VGLRQRYSGGPDRRPALLQLVPRRLGKYDEQLLAQTERHGLLDLPTQARRAVPQRDDRRGLLHARDHCGLPIFVRVEQLHRVRSRRAAELLVLEPDHRPVFGEWAEYLLLDAVKRLRYQVRVAL